MLVVIILAIFMELSTSLSYLLLPKSNTHDLFPGLGRESKKPLIIFQLLCFDDVTIDFTQSKFVTASGKLSQTFYINLFRSKN